MVEIRITTKEQERKALAKITEILNTLEPESYVRMAITPRVLEMAAENIEMDFGNSPDDQIEYWQKTASGYREELFTVRQELDSANRRIEESDDDHRRVCEERDALEDQLRREKEAWGELNSAAIALENKAAKLENDNIRLKAKLYDLMTERNS